MLIKKYTTTNALGRIIPLYTEHGIEVTGRQVNIDLAACVRMFDAGLICLYTLETFDEECVGYSMWMKSLDIWFAHVLRGEELGVYVQPRYRGRWGLRLIRYAEEDMIFNGTKRLMRSASVSSTYGRTLDKMGYKPLQTIYLKEVH